MNGRILLMFSTWCCIALVVGVLRAADLQGNVEAMLQDMPAVMVPLTNREAPSEEEWESLHEDTQRAGLFGSLADFKSPTISFMGTRYFTNNCAEGTLASYGKMDKSGFDRFGHIAAVEFDVPANSWKERYALNAAALVKLTGTARFAEFAGVGLDTAAQDRRQIEVTFLGTMVPKDEAIRRLNQDVEALEYLSAVHAKRAQHKNRFGLLGGSPPPAPKVVLANVMMLDARTSRMLDAGVGSEAKSILHGVGGKLELANQRFEDRALLTPVVRCYRTYSIEFRTDSNGNLERALRTGPDGRQAQVPVVFDLTPDL